MWSNPCLLTAHRIARCHPPTFRRIAATARYRLLGAHQILTPKSADSKFPDWASSSLNMRKIPNHLTPRIWALLAVTMPMLAGCSNTGNHVTAWGEITLRPGDTGACTSNPCRVFFEMPPGDERYKLTGTGFTIGEYPAGKTVMIGSFFDSSAIKVEGAGLPPAYIYVPSSSSSDMH